MFDAKRVAEDFSSAAANYDRHAALQQKVLGELLQLGKDYFPKQALVLDAGCGTGALKKLAPPWTVIQTDLAFGMCVQAKIQSPLTVNAALEQLPFPAQHFDGVIASLVMQWVSDTARVLKEFVELLKPGGTAILATFGPASLRELREVFSHMDTHAHISNFTPLATLADAGRQAGFEIVEFSQREEYMLFANATALMRHLKALGARHKMLSRRQGLMTPRQLRALNRHYQANHADGKEVRSTWQIDTLVMRKS